MTREEAIPNFMAYAIIIITAHHLGCEVEELEKAREVWKTKRLPDAIVLGTYQKAALTALDMVTKKGLEEKADRFGEVFYYTGEFPGNHEIRQYQEYLSAYVLRSTQGDCTGGGVSSLCNYFYLFASHLTFAEVVNYCIEKGMELDRALKLVNRPNLNYVHAEPVIGRDRYYMAGGNYIYTCDSRYKILSGIPYPVPVHDRIEG